MRSWCDSFCCAGIAKRGTGAGFKRVGPKSARSPPRTKKGRPQPGGKRRPRFGSNYVASAPYTRPLCNRWVKNVTCETTGVAYARLRACIVNMVVSRSLPAPAVRPATARPGGQSEKRETATALEGHPTAACWQPNTSVTARAHIASAARRPLCALVWGTDCNTRRTVVYLRRVLLYAPERSYSTNQITAIPCRWTLARHAEPATGQDGTANSPE